MASQVLLATRSEGKLRELRPLFESAGIAVADLREAALSPSADEDGVEAFDTFEANALAKARYFHALTGRPTIADDSGLEVAALAGAPGVRSKRWSARTDLTGQALDDANNARLLDALREVREPVARYVCAAAYCDGAREEVTRGETAGIIVRDARGEHGFGYDPFFFLCRAGRDVWGEFARSKGGRESSRSSISRSTRANPAVVTCHLKFCAFCLRLPRSYC